MYIRILKFFAWLIALILLIDGIILMSQNKIHLGTVLPAFIGIIIIVCLFFNKKIQLYRLNHSNFNLFWKMGWTIFSIWLISLAIFFIFLAKSNHSPIMNTPPDAIIILGSGLINNHPSPTLQARLDQGATIAAQYSSSSIIVTGGLGFDQKITEAAVMKAYLIDKYRIHPQRIFEESQSTSTELNLKNSVPLLNRIGLNQDSHIVVVTSDFHTPRAAAIARFQGYTQITSVSAETPLTTRYNAWLREYFAYISGWILREY